MLKGNFFVIISVSLFGLMSAANVTELCNLAPGSVILQPNSCTDWLKCGNTPESGDMEEGSCVFGLYFNKNTGKCDYKDNVACPFEKKQHNKNRCTYNSNGEFFGDDEHCNAYIYCRDGREVKSFCPNNLVFDRVKKACVYRTQYKCPANNTTSEGDTVCHSIKDETSFADKHDCTKYNQCHKGALVRHSCNNSFAWSYIDRKCMPIDDVVCYPSAKKPEPELKVCIDRVGPVSDGISCSGYYFCKKMSNDTHDRNPAHFSCAPNYFFDSNTLSCRDRVNVKCTLDRCEGMGNKYVNTAGDCRAYVLCVNGVAESKGTCPSTHYFDERTQGCTLQTVNYAACSA